jgi:hypothetical protein
MGEVLLDRTSPTRRTQKCFQEFDVDTAFMRFRSNKFVSTVFVLFVLLIAGLGLYNSVKAKSVPPAAPVLSESALEEQYGVRVNLVAVTASGGMVDLRLKIMDARKAKLLLQDQANFPSLYVNDANVTLNASEDAKTQPIKFDANNSLFLLYPNSRNAVKPGTPVNILFGKTIMLEPIEAR